MKDYIRIKTHGGTVYYMELSEEEVMKRDRVWLFISVPVLTLAFVYGCAFAAGIFF